MIAFLGGEAGADVVEEVLTRPNEMCLAHGVNLCEVYYYVYGKSNEAMARQAIADLVEGAGIIPRHDMDNPFWMEAGKQRAEIRGAGQQIALADCFAIALALRVGGTVVTSDHHEFDYVHAQGICPVLFFR